MFAEWGSKTLRAGAVMVLSMTMCATAGAWNATAAPITASDAVGTANTSPNGSRLDSVTQINDRELTLSVFSASMQKLVPVHVQLPADSSAPRPSLYFLDGGIRREKTDVVEFMADKNVNVISPTGGEDAYWMDWKNPDPVLGVNKWKTFLTQELPPIADSALGTNGVNAIAGMSRVGTAALQLAIASPGLYQGVAAYSGCATTSDFVGQQIIALTMNNYGKGNPENMYGPPNDPLWAANDPYVHAAELRGVELFVSSGNGLPGAYERIDGPGINGNLGVLARQAVAGGAIEAVANYCTHRLAARLADVGVLASFNFRDNGTHSWGYWEDDLHASWPVLARALGV